MEAVTLFNMALDEAARGAIHNQSLQASSLPRSPCVGRSALEMRLAEALPVCLLDLTPPPGCLLRAAPPFA